MADMVIKIQADATGWHKNVNCQGPYLEDGWAVVAQGDRETVAACGGVVDFQMQYAPPEEYPEVVDRRTADRGQPYPVTAAMTAGTYVPPEAPEQPEEEYTDTQVLNKLLGVEE